jgi:hypothetical protein
LTKAFSRSDSHPQKLSSHKYLPQATSRHVFFTFRRRFVFWSDFFLYLNTIKLLKERELPGFIKEQVPDNHILQRIENNRYIIFSFNAYCVFIFKKNQDYLKTKNMENTRYKTTTFGGGCFWFVKAI